MTIKKGEPWGTSFVVPLQTRDVGGDEDLADGLQSDIHILSSGDLFDALGKPSRPQVGDVRTIVHIDAMLCEIQTPSGVVHMQAASSVAIGGWLKIALKQQRFICITNAGFFKGLNIVPRSHPNDGCVDVFRIDESMTPRQRLIARKKAVSGDHLGHPQLSVDRVQHCEFSRHERHEKLYVDGRFIRDWISISVKVVPDYWQVIV